MADKPKPRLYFLWDCGGCVKLPKPSPSTSHAARLGGSVLQYNEISVPGDDEIGIRVVLSCGHTADPDSVIQWCKIQLSQGKTTFHCPVPVKSNKTCNAVWSYAKIRKIAQHIGEEMGHFEEAMACTTAKQCCEYKQCPGCSTLVERKDMENLRVRCIVCTARKGKIFEFCWQCLKPWRGGGTSSERCNNAGCKDHRLDILQNCSLTDLPDSELKSCPSIRACPVCGLLIEHREKCKYMTCNQCSKEFCFACLEGAEICQRDKRLSYYKTCSKPIAPRQTSVPVWSGKMKQSKLSTADNAVDDLHQDGSDVEFLMRSLQRQERLLQLLQVQLRSEPPPPPQPAAGSCIIL